MQKMLLPCGLPPEREEDWRICQKADFP
jgi:hypothetical protein